jgi:ankyrin repeat protein
MKARFAYQAVLGMVLICQFSVCLGKEAPDPNQSSKYLDAVREFADNVLKYGRDTYGPKKTPLFVDGLNTETLQPVVWHFQGEEWILSNFANHQSLLRLLDGLTALTGEPKYRQAALDASAYALEHLRTPNGLLYWGGHLAWDLQKERGVSAEEAHELKEQSPYYELLWEANPSETKRLMEAIWGAHVLDWAKLDFNRHSSSTTAPRPAQWTHEFDENLPCPFPSLGNNWSMANIAGSLLHTGASLAKLGEHREALLWTKRLAQRWRSARHPLTGLCGGLLSVPQEKRARKFLGHKHPNISDATMVAGWLMDERYRFLTLCQMQVGEEMGDNGLDLIRWASDDLKAFARYAYDEESLSFRPLLTDGTELNWREFNPGYYSPQGLAPQKASDWTLWVYATAYRLTKDPAHWKLLRSIWGGLDLGDLGTETGDGRHLNHELKAASYPLLYACLDLHTATKDNAFLMSAQRVADNIVAARTHDRCLPKDYFYVRTGDEAMLAVLHLAAALQGKSQKIPQPRADRQYFHCAFSGAVGSGRTLTDPRVWDEPLIYSKRKGYSILLPGSSEPPISLYEAISIGNREIVRALFAQGPDIKNMHNLLYPAVQGGNKDIVEFLLAKGADVNVKGGWQEETPLHCAATLKNGREMIELLVAKRADLNAGNWKGDTPLQYAAYYDHKDIIELLLQKDAIIANLHIASYLGDLDKAEAFIKDGVDIDATDGHGYAALHYAVRNNQKKAVELLVATGADVNVENWEGQTPLDVAISRGYKEIAELLLNKGANINAADNAGNTSLHRAAQDGQRDMAAFLIDKGADVNAKDNSGLTALFHAAMGGQKELAELLVEKGADVNVKDQWGYTLFHYALWYTKYDVAKLLIDKGSDIHAKDESGYTHLHWASMMGNQELARLILGKGGDVGAKDNEGGTALHHAASSGQKELCELLLAKGAELNAKNNNGQTALDVAVLQTEDAVAKLLIEKGAQASTLNVPAYRGELDKIKAAIEGGLDVNAKGPDGETLLHSAARGGRKDVVEFLIANGADVNAAKTKGGTPFLVAIWSDHLDVAELLLAKGADLHAKTKNLGQTALHWTADRGRKEAVELLLGKGADVNAKDSRGRTALSLAQAKGHTEIVELLLNRGAKE